MATQRSPHTPSSIPAQPNRSAFPSSIPSVRRPSTSTIPTYNAPTTQVLTPSPSSSSPATPSSIPSFRSLRSLLPFGPNKQATPVSSTVSPSSHVSRSPFANFGSVRRSMNRERQASFSSDLPVISIERTPEPTEEDVIRKSVSCSKLEKPLPDEPQAISESTSLRGDNDDTIVLSSAHDQPVLRAPSPGPPISADLSTILEADNSGISKYIPSSSSSSPSPSPSLSSPNDANQSSHSAPFIEEPVLDSRDNNEGAPQTGQETDTDTSILDLSTTHLTNQVLDAMMAEDSSTANQWLNADKAVIIDGDNSEHGADASFNLGALDPDLAALLSPHRLSSNPKNLRIIPQRAIESSQPSPSSPTFILPSIGSLNSSPNSPGLPSGSLSGSTKVLSRSRLPRQQSSLPRLRPTSLHSPTTSSYSSTATTPITPKSASQLSPETGYSSNASSTSLKTQPQSLRHHVHVPPSPLSSSISASASTHAPNSTSTSVSASTSTSTLSTSSASLSARRAVPQTRIVTPSMSTSIPRPGIPTSTPLATRISSLTGKRPPLRHTLSAAASPSSEWGEKAPAPESFIHPSHISPSPSPSPSLSSRAGARTGAQPSLDLTRGSSDNQRTFRPSLESTSQADRRQEEEREDVSSSSPPSPRGSFAGLGIEHDQGKSSFDGTRGHTGRSDGTTWAGSGALPPPSPSLSSATPPSAANSSSTITATAKLTPTSAAGLLASRARKRSMSVQERLGRTLQASRNGGEHVFSAMGGMGDGARRRGQGRAEEYLGVEDVGRPTSSLEGGFGRRGAVLGSGGGGSAGDRPPATEWLGPRTVKAFKAAGLMDYERERDSERSGNLNGMSALGRFASMRSTSEYSPRTQSRMAFSEAGGSVVGGSGGGGSVSRRGSESFSNYGLMESPTFTASSGSRDTPRSASTAPTSVSGSSFGYFGRERDRDRDRDRDREKDREEVRELKEKHATETGALLGALSDSQRTTRVLREENGDLRERLERLGHVEVENDGLRRAVGELRQEVGDLRMQLIKAQNRMGTWNGGARRSGLSTSITPAGDQSDDEDWGQTMIGARVLPAETKQSPALDHHELDDHVDQPFTHADIAAMGPASSSTPAPASRTHRRRFSTTSSIFPVPPANMTMLLHDSDPNDDGASFDHSRFSSPPASIRQVTKGHAHKGSVASIVSISPTTANFSMVTGSPGSLFLRPEHEVHLGDMDSLDLGMKGPDEDGDEDDMWGH